MYSPIDTLQATSKHLQEHLKAHAIVGVAWFFGLQFVVWAVIFVGMGAMFSVMLLTDGDPDAQGLALAGLLGVGGIGYFGLIFGIVTLVSGYQRAALAEVDGGAEVSLGGVAAATFASLGTILGLLFVQFFLGIIGILMCYVGILVTVVPLHFTFLLTVDRGLSLPDAMALAWATFWARWKEHLLFFFTQMAASLLLSMIPIVGGMIALPVIVVFDVLSYRVFYPKEAVVPA